MELAIERRGNFVGNTSATDAASFRVYENGRLPRRSAFSIDSISPTLAEIGGVHCPFAFDNRERIVIGLNKVAEVFALTLADLRHVDSGAVVVFAGPWLVSVETAGHGQHYDDGENA